MSQVLLFIIVFLTGLIIGSFLNCVIYRLEHKELSSFMRGRSFCPHCKHTLSWRDLIPIFSFLILKRKCRYCHGKISLQYPLVELATGLLFVLLLNYELGVMNYEFFDFRLILNSLFLILASCFLIIIFVYDLKHFIIPDKIIYPAIIITLLYNLILNSQFISNPTGSLSLRSIQHNSIFAALGAAIFFLMIVLISRGKWMGIGDIKLAFFMGLLLSFPDILVALFFAFLIGAIIGIGLILTKRKTLKSEVPFGPFLITGTFIAMFWGQTIINWYLSLFLIS